MMELIYYLMLTSYFFLLNFFFMKNSGILLKLFDKTKDKTKDKINTLDDDKVLELKMLEDEKKYLEELYDFKKREKSLKDEIDEITNLLYGLGDKKETEDKIYNRDNLYFYVDLDYSLSGDYYIAVTQKDIKFFELYRLEVNYEHAAKRTQFCVDIVLNNSYTMFNFLDDETSKLISRILLDVDTRIFNYTGV